MRSIEDKGCLSYGGSKGMSSSTTSFEFQKVNNNSNNGCALNRTPHHHRAELGKPTPSKWDDAQKWLVNLSRGGEKRNFQSRTTPRNSNADDLRLIGHVPKVESYFSEGEGEGGGGGFDRSGPAGATQYDVETKNVDCEESIWRINKLSKSTAVVRSVCVRDTGTEMTPIGSQEPSRTATPLRATTPAARSPLSSGASTPVNGAVLSLESGQTCVAPVESSGEVPGANVVTRLLFPRDGEEVGNANGFPEQKSAGQSKNVSPLETRAMAWDEAERAKYTARYKREEVKIQAWENHEKRKAEMEKRRVEVKAERLKSRAQEKYNNKLAATTRIAEEKRANAESKLNEKAVKTSERADYIRRTGHLPSSFSFKLPFFCCSCSNNLRH